MPSSLGPLKVWMYSCAQEGKGASLEFYFVKLKANELSTSTFDAYCCDI
jgi:hypothetical protein